MVCYITIKQSCSKIIFHLCATFSSTNIVVHIQSNRILFDDNNLIDYKSEYGSLKLLIQKFIFGVVSCVKPNDLILRNFFHIGYIWKVLLLCVFCGVALIHQNVQISIHSLPKDNGMVFHLQRRSNQLIRISTLISKDSWGIILNNIIKYDLSITKL